jgi:hypothetical protein
MDFIVSKVAMSICALLVASVLCGVVDENVLFRSSGELRAVLDDLTSTIEASAYSGSESDIMWTVPFLSNGDSIDVSVNSVAIKASAGQESAIVKLTCRLHTWTWNGSSLNKSSLEPLDASSPSVESRSGHGLGIAVRVISFENQDAAFVFVRATD